MMNVTRVSVNLHYPIEKVNKRQSYHDMKLDDSQGEITGSLTFITPVDLKSQTLNISKLGFPK
jgi:hypothetical protein